MFRFHNPPAGESLYEGYAVTLNGASAPLFAARVSAMPYNTVWPGHQRPIDQTELLGFASFTADAPVTVTVTYPHAPEKVVVRPLSKGVAVSLAGNVASFTLPSAGQYTCEADGWHNALTLFFDPPANYEARAEGTTVLRYPAGVHHIGHVELSSNTTVLLDEGAVLYGSFTAICAENVKILGGGVIDGSEEKRVTGSKMFPPYDFHYRVPQDKEGIREMLASRDVLHGLIRFYRCKNCVVDGPVLRDSPTFGIIPAGCENVLIERVKLIGMWRYNSDGVDVFNSSNVVLRDSFLRNFDDCVVLKGIMGWDDRNLENILVERCVVWCDWGRNLELGAETNAPEYRNILFRDCDNIHADMIYMDIQHHNRADIHDVIFEDIRCEYEKNHLPSTYQHDMNAPFDWHRKPAQPLLVALPIYADGLFSDDGRNGKTHDITFRRIRILNDAEGLPKPRIQLLGLDEERAVRRVRFEDVTIDGKPASASDFAIEKNEFVYDVTFA